MTKKKVEEAKAESIRDLTSELVALTAKKAFVFSRKSLDKAITTLEGLLVKMKSEASKKGGK